MSKVKNQYPKVYKIGRVGDMLLGRPEGMPFEKYRELRTMQSKRLKARLKGVFVWKSRGPESWGTLVGPVPKVVIA